MWQTAKKSKCFNKILNIINILYGRKIMIITDIGYDKFWEQN